ncbi:uncharacterized protein [Ranitomeya imitator]|uniref:uncharacterized protein isoform X2 n=1 Tax=Ranitomeya imitator TaxID=111125 RepID=UPI0037E8CA3B
MEAPHQEALMHAPDSTTLQVINLSEHVLTSMELSVLQRGLSFVPTHIADKFTLIKDLYLFCRKLTFQVMHRRPDILQTMPIDERQTFQDLLELLEENEPSSHRKRFPHRNKSLRTPSFSLVPAIKIFFEVVKRDIMAMPIRVSGPSNLNIEERRALTALQNNKNFTIKEANKGGNVVLWSTQLYETEAKRQLSNVQYYQKLPSDPTSIFLPKYEQLLCRALQRDIISSQEKQYLWVANPVTATFYMLPKIHKDSTRPPGRPIVSSIGSMCEKAMTPPFWTCEYSHMNNIWRLISSESPRQQTRFWNFPASTLGTQSLPKSKGAGSEVALILQEARQGGTDQIYNRF